MDEDKDRNPITTSALTEIMTYEIEEFIAVRESDDDVKTTTADLVELNAFLAATHAALPMVRTVAGLCMLANTACKLIERRRKVKKLPIGESVNKKGGRVYEIYE